MTDRRLLLVHAHPDDETLTTGATMARYAAEGAHVALVTCTLGEEGEVIPPELAHLSGDALGRHRVGELAAACAALGVTDSRFLGGPGRWRDSGMMGTPPNDDPRCFWQADLEEATAALVAVVREVRPQVVVSYDERGGYGHPDHVQAHRVTLAACRSAALPAYRPDLGEPWQVSRRYATAAPRSALEAGLAALRSEPSPFVVLPSVDDLAFGNPDDEITTTVDATAHLERKVAAMRAHATQIAVAEPFYALSDLVGHALCGVEHFVLAEGDPAGVESDLFGGAE